jgi:hypothetical protein
MPKGVPKNKPVTLYPLDFEEAVRRVLQAPHPRVLEQSDAAPEQAPPKSEAKSKKRG